MLGQAATVWLQRCALCLQRICRTHAALATLTISAVSSPALRKPLTSTSSVTFSLRFELLITVYVRP